MNIAPKIKLTKYIYTDLQICYLPLVLINQTIIVKNPYSRSIFHGCDSVVTHNYLFKVVVCYSDGQKLKTLKHFFSWHGIPKFACSLSAYIFPAQNYFGQNNGTRQHVSGCSTMVHVQSMYGRAQVKHIRAHRQLEWSKLKVVITSLNKILTIFSDQ